MKDYYQAIAPDYARHRRVHPEVLRCLIATAELSSSSSVLEVGCGTGNYLRALYNQVGCGCWGIDSSQTMLAQAREHLRGAKLLCAAAERMGLAAGQFHLVFAVDVVHHIMDRPRAFHECYAVMRGNGRLCLVTESPAMIRRREPHATYFPAAVAVELARYPGIITLRAELDAVGFVDLMEQEVQCHTTLDNIEPYRTKAHSSLSLIPEDDFARGIERFEQDLRLGPVPVIWRYLLLWAIKPVASAKVF